MQCNITYNIHHTSEYIPDLFLNREKKNASLQWRVISNNSSSMHKNSTCTLIRHATFFKITSTKYPNFTVKPLYLLWWCRGEDNLGIGLLASKKAVQDIRRSLVLAQYFLSYGVSKSSGQTTSKSPWGPTYSRNKRRKDPKYFRILSTAS